MFLSLKFMPELWESSVHMLERSFIIYEIK